MITAFRESFAKDLRKNRRNRDLLSHLREIILEVEAAESIAHIRNLRRLKSDGPYFRIRAGNYRVGLIVERDTVIFVRVLHRKEVYRYFP
jgi:mRNA interferase RelE/StbE